jgi:hypothetical protein
MELERRRKGIGKRRFRKGSTFFIDQIHSEAY